MRYGYGGIRDQVLELTVVLPDGCTIRAGRPLVKNVAGYDLAKLFLGAHGSLGVITDVTLKLAAIPRARTTLAFPLDDVNQAQRCAGRLLRTCLVASALLLCRGCDVPGVDAPFALVYTAEGWPGDVRAELDEAKAQMAGEAGPAITMEVSGNEIWAGWLSAGDGGGLLRVGVGPGSIAGFLTSGTLSGGTTWIADLASGLVYVRGMPDVTSVRQTAHRLSGYAIVLGVPAHGERPADRWGYRPDCADLMAALKRRWDPDGYLNPGAFLV
jgi:D-lactate dehydrogenase (cytochrome)